MKEENEIMAKKKSLNDIISQSERLKKALRTSLMNTHRPENGWSNQQVRQMYEKKSQFSKMRERIVKTTDTYINNILHSKQFQDAFKEKYEGEPYQERENRAFNTKIPSNIYIIKQ